MSSFNIDVIDRAIVEATQGGLPLVPQPYHAVAERIGVPVDAVLRRMQAMQEAGVKTPPSPGPGESVDTMKYEHPLQGLWARVVTAPGTYEQGMLIDQLSNIVRVEGGADQKVGAESRRRFEDLMNEMKAIEAELAKTGQHP